MKFLNAVAHEEGFYVAGSRSARNFNPGDINWGPFAMDHGATGLEIIPHGYTETARFASFPDAATGFAAMQALFRVPGVFANGKLVGGYAGSTVRQALARFAPAADGNDVSSYEAAVCELVGCQPTDCIDQLVAEGWE